MPTLNELTEEFVRHHCLLIDRTRDDPSRVAVALEEHPDLGASIERLRNIELAIIEHRAFSKQPFRITYRKFKAAEKDFRNRWGHAYEEFRKYKYTQAVRSVYEEFMRCYNFLVERTGNDPSAVKALREERPELHEAIERLHLISFVLDDQPDVDGLEGDWEERSRLVAKARQLWRLMADAPAEFHDALSDYTLRWDPACYNYVWANEVII